MSLQWDEKKYTNDSDDDDFQSSIEMIEKIKDRLKDYRSAGLEREGEYSYENLVFKFLRRNGYIQKLFDFAVIYN